METESYSQAVGAFLRWYRLEHDLTLDAVARAGREFGAKWRMSSVQAIEAGKASPTLPTLLTLALALGSLTGKPLTLVDLLGRAESFDAPDAGGPVTGEWVAQALSGAPIVPPERQNPRSSGRREDESDLDQLIRMAFKGATQPEYRAARQLDIHPVELQRDAFYLWSRSLDEESALRAGPDATPQKRGRVTRGLIEELRQARAIAAEQGGIVTPRTKEA